MTAASLFKQADVKRALEAVKAAGLPISRIEIDPTTGRIVIQTDQTQSSGKASGWDDLEQILSSRTSSANSTTGTVGKD